MNNKITLGQQIKMTVHVGGYKYNDNVTVSYIHDDKIVTCGHCLPANSKLHIGQILYTSGFDTPEESKELGIIKVNNKDILSDRFMNKKVSLNKSILNINVEIINVFLNNIIKAKVIYYCDKKLDHGLITIDNYIIDHQITKLDLPYYIVIQDTNKQHIKKTITNFKLGERMVDYYPLTSPGYSGSPWLLDGDDYKHVGIHIGKTKAMIKGNKNVLYDVAYVKPISDNKLS
jgi:hypothetical protein